MKATSQIQQFHPLPWRVDYWQRFDTWHPKSYPRVIDADGKLVCDMPSKVTAGAYDAIADLAAQAIAESVQVRRADSNQKPPDAGKDTTR
jgi:hypothetical protein